MPTTLPQLIYPEKNDKIPHLMKFSVIERKYTSDTFFSDQTTAVIGLYVSETIVYDQNQAYDSPNMLDAVRGIAGRGGHYFAGLARGASYLSSLTEFVKSGGSTNKPTGVLGNFGINPVVSVLYTHPELRTFQFDFNFAPSSETEAKIVEEIIKKFRYHSSPSFLDKNTLVGNLILRVPERWSIEFLSTDLNGSLEENSRIPKIKPCVLESVNINYTPENQFVTTIDNFPVHTQLRLQFKEIEIITKEAINEGF